MQKALPSGPKCHGTMADLDLETFLGYRRPMNYFPTIFLFPCLLSVCPILNSDSMIIFPYWHSARPRITTELDNKN